MECKNCRAELEKDGAFCGKCGMPVKKKSKAPLYIGLIIGVSILAVAAILLIFNFGTNAYDKQIDIGYDLLDDGKYEEAVLAFDKAIEIDEKRPEGYMGKAESMAHDPEMTPEKAGEIVGVIQLGYEKSGDKKVLDHKKVVGEIIRKNGFSEEAEIVEDLGKEEAVLKNYASMAFFGDKAIEISDKGLYIINLETDEKELVFEGCLCASFVADGKIAFVVDDQKDELYKIDLDTRSAEKLIKIKYSEEIYEEMKSEILSGESVEECFCIDIIGFAGDYIHFNNNLFIAFENYCYNIKTNEYKESNISAYAPGRILSYKDKIFYNEGYAEQSYDELYMANADGSGETVIDESIAGYFWIVGNKMYYYHAENGDYNSGDEVWANCAFKEYNLDTGEIKNLDQPHIVDACTGFGFAYDESTEYGLEKYTIAFDDGTTWKNAGYCYSADSRYNNISTSEEMMVSYVGDYVDGYEYTLLFKDRKSTPFKIEDYDAIVGYNDGKVYYKDGESFGTGYEIKSIELSFEEYGESENSSDAYKAEYKAFLKERSEYVNSDDHGFTLAYIDDDEIPELIYSCGDYHGAGADVYSFKDGKMIKITVNGKESDNESGSMGSNGSITYAEREGLILSGYSGMGITTEGILKLENGDAKKICTFYKDWNDENNIKYKVNDKDVSKSEYEKESAKYESYSWKSSRFDEGFYSLSYENVKEVLGN